MSQSLEKSRESDGMSLTKRSFIISFKCWSIARLGRLLAQMWFQESLIRCFRSKGRTSTSTRESDRIFCAFYVISFPPFPNLSLLTQLFKISCLYGYSRNRFFLTPVFFNYSRNRFFLTISLHDKRVKKNR